MRLFFRQFFFRSLFLDLFGLYLLSSDLLRKSSWLFTLFRFRMNLSSSLLFFLNLFFDFLNDWIVYLPYYRIFWWLSLMESHIYRILFLLFILLLLRRWLFGYWLALYLILSLSFTFYCSHIEVSPSLPSYLASHIRTIKILFRFRQIKWFANIFWSRLSLLIICCLIVRKVSTIIEFLPSSFIFGLLKQLLLIFWLKATLITWKIIIFVRFLTILYSLRRYCQILIIFQLIKISICLLKIFFIRFLLLLMFL